MPGDPAVQSLRVAVALCDRFTALMKEGPVTVKSHRRHGDLFGVSGGDDALSLRIGEAQQMYPEIWRHLDDARTAFAAAGVDVASYDAVRAEEGRALGVDVDIQARSVAGPYGSESQTKTAMFNQGGVARARKAAATLMVATPHIDWAAIAKAETHDPAAEAFGRDARNKRFLVFGLIAIAIASPFLIVMYLRMREHQKLEDWKHQDTQVAGPVTLDPAARAELTASIARLQAGVASARKDWAVAAGPGALLATFPGTQPCPRAVHPPDDVAADAFIRTGDVDPKAFASSDFQAFTAAPDGLPDVVLRRTEALLRRLDPAKATEDDRADVARIAYWTAVMIDHDVEPEVTQTAPHIVYRPGELTGRAYVYSVADAKFICAAAIIVHNTPSDPKFLDDVRRAPEAVERLHRELEVGIRRALATGLRAIGP